MIEEVADRLANKIYDGIKFLFESQIEALANIFPELLGIALALCGLIMMFGNLQKWLARSGIVVVVGTALVVIL
jgi:hypothetical protein